MHICRYRSISSGGLNHAGSECIISKVTAVFSSGGSIAFICIMSEKPHFYSIDVIITVIAVKYNNLSDL